MDMKFYFHWLDNDVFYYSGTGDREYKLFITQFLNFSILAEAAERQQDAKQIKQKRNICDYSFQL